MSMSGQLEQGGTLVLDHPSPSVADLSTIHEQVYREARGDLARVRWAHAGPNPAMVAWLNAESAGRIRPGARAVVVGCGLGDDVAELTGRGYDATGFDIAPTAVEWARKRFPDQASAFMLSDLLHMPTKFRHRFDLVVECYTLQSMHPSQREQAAAAIAELACPRGLVLAIARGRDEHELLDEVHGPPFPLSPGEFTGLFESAGMKTVKPIDDFMDDGTPAVRRLRGAFVHA